MQIPPLFDIPGRLLDVQPVPSGHIHHTFISRWDDRGEVRRFVHQRLNEHVFRDAAALMDNIAAVTRYLQGVLQAEGAAETALTLVPAKSGGMWGRDSEGRAWRTYVCIENAVSYDLCPDPRHAAMTGESFGRFIRRMAGFEGRLTEPIHRFQDIGWRLEQLESAINDDPAGRRAGTAQEIEECVRRKELARLFADGLAAGVVPKRVTHADPKINNLLFSAETGRPVCIVDLDTCMEGTLLYDFGDMVRTGAAAAAEDEADLGRVAIDMPLFTALTQGFVRGAGDILQAGELRLLHRAPQVLTWCQAVRFLADYLNGDVYYRVQHPEHNLQRTRAQLALLRSMEEHAEGMEECVAASSPTWWIPGRPWYDLS